MTEISDRYRRLAVGFTERVVAVPQDRWSSPSPCPGWSARDVVAHMVDSAGWFFRAIGRTPPETPPATEDPVGAWLAVRDAVQTALEDPETATAQFEGRMGRQTFEQAVDRFVNFDVLVHTWDLARAAGLDERLDPAEVHAVFEAAKPMDEMLRGSGAFGPKLEPPPGADEQTELLAFLGRKV